MVFPHNNLILDTCCIINLHASGQMANILTSLQTSIAVADYILEKEISGIHVQSRDTVARTERAINLQPLIDQRLLTVSSLETEAEKVTFISFAASLGDGDAITSAIAVTRNWAIATDDRRSIRFLKQMTPTLAVVSTLELIKFWVDSTQPSFDIVEETLRNVRDYGKYEPGANHSLYHWWKGFMKERTELVGTVITSP